MRLFVAIELDDEHRRLLAAELERLERRAPHAKWVPVANAHLTLVFLGEVEEARVASVRAAMDEVAGRHARHTLALRGGGAFGSPSHPKVLWVGVQGQVEAAKKVQAELSSALREQGFELEERVFAPHLTLARSRAPRGDEALAACVDHLRRVDLGELRVEQLLLFQSQLSSRGPTYARVHAASLGA